MTQFSQPLARLGARLVRPLGRLATLIAGFMMMIVGLGSAVTIVMLPMGIVVGLAGVGLFVCSLFAPQAPTES